jgi:hypothetical protein
LGEAGVMVGFKIIIVLILFRGDLLLKFFGVNNLGLEGFGVRG